MTQKTFYKIPGIAFRCLSIFLGTLLILALVSFIFLFADYTQLENSKDVSTQQTESLNGNSISTELNTSEDLLEIKKFLTSNYNFVGVLSAGLNMLIWCLIYWFIGSLCFLPPEEERKIILSRAANLLKKIRNLLIAAFFFELTYVTISGINYSTWYPTAETTSLSLFIEDLVIFTIPNISGITILVVAFIIGLVAKVLVRQVEVEDELDMVV